MIVALRSNELFINYEKRFSDDVITAEPYNYQVVLIPDDIDLSVIAYSDFDNIEGKYIFNISKFNLRIQAEKEKETIFNYKTQIDELIREKYSINDEIAILRQRDTKTNEFNEYFEFVENIKQRVRMSRSS